MGRLFAIEPAPADYPNHLADPQPERLRLPPAGWLLLGLVVLCLVPRAAMALRIPGICPDGVVYVNIARNIEAGDLRAAFREMALNIYPVILMLLHRLGLDWDLAARIWGVAVSSIVVLPLWGWVRRAFDDRVALVACLLYAVHPKFIEWSPEAMRDQTFWLLFMLAIYWLWRAATEVRYGFFIAAGAAIALASLTRIEGLFLLVPLTLWTFWRWLALTGSSHPSPLPAGKGTARRQLLLGAILCVAVFPLLLVLVNVFWLCGHSGWTTIRFDMLARAQSWIQSLFGRGPALVSEDSLDQPMTVGRMIWVYFPALTRGFGPVFPLLMFGGMWGWRRVWARRDHQVLFYTALVFLGGIWVQLWFDKTLCPRYVLPIALMGSPFAALGLLGLSARLVRVVQRLGWNARRQAAVAAGVMAVVAIVGLADAMTGNTKYFETRRIAMELGQRLGQEYAFPPRIVGPPGISPIASYYAHSGPYTVVGYDANDALILTAALESRPDVVILRPWKQLTPRRCELLTAPMLRSGLRRVRPDLVTGGDCDLYVLVRGNQIDLARKPMQGR
jgi:hypothetical protein